MSSDKRPSPASADTGKSRWSSGGGARGMRLWIAIIIVTMLLVGAVAAVLLSGTTNASAPQAPKFTPGPLPSPTDLYASGTTDGAVLLSWQPIGGGAIGYRIYRATGRHGPYTIVGTVNAPDIDTFTDDRDLTPGATYAYTVTAFNRQGQSRPAGPIVAVLLAAATNTPMMGVPQPPPTFQPVSPATLTALAKGSGGVRTLPTLAAPTGVVPTVPAVLPTPAVRLPIALPTITPPGTVPTPQITRTTNVLTPAPTISFPSAVPTTPQQSTVSAPTPPATVQLPTAVASATPRS